MAYPKTVDAFKSKLKYAASIPTLYWNAFPYNCGYKHSDGRTSWDCVNLVKTLLNGWEPSNVVGSYCSDFSRTGDCTEWGLLQQCSNVSTDFSNLNYLAVLYLPGHIGVYLGESVEINGKTYNTIECTAAWGGGVLYSYTTKNGGRYNHKDGTKSSSSWTHHGKMTKWLEYAFSGWKKIKGQWFYFVEDVPQTGWIKDKGYWYYLDANGVMQTGWLKDKGSWYLLADKGEMLTGWQKNNKKWYYLKGDGKMKTGWFKDGGEWYYLKPGDSGRMLTGWQKISGKWYYFKDGGQMLTGWLKWRLNWYYLGIDGAMVTGEKQIDGKTYIFDDDGRMIKEVK